MLAKIPDEYWVLLVVITLCMVMVGMVTCTWPDHFAELQRYGATWG